ncbi:glutamine--tRNA ligase/YqeY domain fusion protein [bacterium]|nr:glutamine--tRNA ligase/YqeY domain fusion protein [bacterium]
MISNNIDLESTKKSETKDFIRQIIDKDIESGKYGGRVHTRFPPEPNGYLHIGHAKAIVVDFGIAEDYHGLTNLRFDDTNPVTEDVEYVDSIQADIKWLGYDWEDRLYYASQYFDKFYEYAQELIKKGLAYVCSLSLDQIKEYRGTVTEAGKPSPDRERPIAESLELLEKMKNGDFAEATYTLRAKIDMSHSNMKMRDPLIYRIKHAHHHQTGDKWHIYPMYDFAHCLEDSIEGITHSLCTLEFQNNRILYDWFLDALEIYHPQQIEFARLNITHTVTSKRKLKQLVDDKIVDGWDDPRMPTICGMRRRGYTPQAVRNFCEGVGLAKRESTVEMALLEYHVRQDLNKNSLRMMGVVNPLKVVITNYPEDQEEWLEAVNNPENPEDGTRLVPFSRELYIEQEDFMEDAPKKFFRLSQGREVRLRYAYFITCTDVIKDQAGKILELHCTYDPETKGGNAPDGRKVKATMHWVSVKHATQVEVRMYNSLFVEENPDKKEEGKTFLDYINPDSLEINQNCWVEPELAKAKAEVNYQFERIGYFFLDSKYSSPEKPVFNRTVTLKDTWAKIKNN